MNRCFHLIADRKEPVQIRSEKLDGNVRLRSGKHRIDTVRDGLTNLNIRTTDGGKLFTHILRHRLPASAFQFEGSFNLRDIHAQRMFIQLRTSRLASHRLNLWHLQQQFLCPATNLIRLLQRDTRQRADIHRKGALVETRQEATSQREEESQCYDKEGNRTA